MQLFHVPYLCGAILFQDPSTVTFEYGIDEDGLSPQPDHDEILLLLNLLSYHYHYIHTYTLTMDMKFDHENIDRNCA